MGVMASTLDTGSAEFRANSEHSAEKIAELRALRRRQRAGGPERARARHVESGRLWPRERVERLLEPGTPFLEPGELAGLGKYDGVPPGAGIITGIGVVSGRHCMAIANDATVKGGTYSGMTCRKHVRAQRIAWANRLPCITLVNSGGAFLPDQANIFPDEGQFGSIFHNQVGMSGDGIPQIAVIMGPCTRRRLYPGALRRSGDRARPRFHVPWRAGADLRRDRRADRCRDPRWRPDALRGLGRHRPSGRERRARARHPPRDRRPSRRAALPAQGAGSPAPASISGRNPRHPLARPARADRQSRGGRPADRRLGVGLGQADIRRHGHAIEARLYAEDPASGFAPSTGRITALSLPDRIRVDSGVETGDAVTPFYDPMIAKLIVHGRDRAAALDALARALDATVVAGVTTNRDFLAALARDAGVGAMQVHIGWIDENLRELAGPRSRGDDRLWHAAAAFLYLAAGRADADPDPWRRRDVFTGWRLGLGDAGADAGQRVTLAAPGSPGEELRVSPVGAAGACTVVDADGPLSFALREIAPGRWRLTHDGEALTFRATARGGLVGIDAPTGRRLCQAAPPLAFAAIETVREGMLTSPLTEAIVKILAAEGDTVAVGDTIAVLESMKMEIPIKAPVSGRAVSVGVAEGEMVERGQRIAEISAEEHHEPAEVRRDP